ncbi:MULTISPECIES: TRAP transporter substrate-binding protein [unclassified Marinobacter]|uniref:TRAP transporter substrate-binding protein n=1 Tax=unclassified Marinobacter TaxID=83889 RepID=UPI00200BC179|nr:MULTISPECIES: TRAP transporter substrate-binding protein [unclassified Marinobacter]MCL1478374.1 TRAP transporter substrate-binding protein [Marinobacter sp.]MCL1480329.1 TRAP transporter substrate-binding protein [Marinobacter sp.]MCL1483801.1 TRAP transporter substrate-binding protein [Marinobacter sp.]UQG55459.1 TRAP transporter substrate-binding protein [Marinobacter sp. M4C]UQG64263.1 TRAP transporter substrate-binding protein [Marinobacter sp. M2C]
MKKLGLNTLVLGISLSLAATAFASEFTNMDPITLRLAHVVNEQDGFHIAAVKFQDLVAERTEGVVNIELYPNASLGDERTLLEGMQIGTVDMGVITNGPVANFVEEMAVFELPFLFPSPQAAYDVLDGPIGQELLDKLSEVNLKGLAYAERGFRNLTNSERPVNTPEDMKGLRIRVMENPVYVDTFRALGANAIPMAWTEALTAMQQNTIDGQENPANVIHSFKLYETQDYMTLSRHTYAPAIFVMGMPAWNKLPEAAQAVVAQAAQEAAEHERRVNAEMESRQLAELREAGMQINDTPDIKAFQAAVVPVYAKYGEKFGDYLPRILEALK